MKTILKELFAKYNLEVNQNQLDAFNKFFEMVVDWNQKINLTAITEKNEFAIKHLLDSCLPATLLPNGATVIDVGAGAGFPSIPLKILRPDLKITMLDSLNKRIIFLNEVINTLGLKDINAIHSRAEDFANKNREFFDVAISRAVASLEILAEYCLPLVKVGGKFVAMKGLNYKEELKNADYAINLLGGKLKQTQKLNIEEIDSIRANFEIEKISQTPKKYPRGKNLPRTNPLISVDK